MPDFVAVKELVEQQVDSYRCSGASLVQALCIRRPLLHLQAFLAKMYPIWSSFRDSVVALES